jgi:hypothetical protein
MTIFPTWACDSIYAKAALASSNAKTLSMIGRVVSGLAERSLFMFLNLEQMWVVKLNSRDKPNLLGYRSDENPSDLEPLVDAWYNDVDRRDVILYT